MKSLVVRLSDSSVDLQGWTAARISRSIDALTGTFELQMSERYPDEVDETSLIAGAAVELLIDGQTVLLTGIIDSIEYSITPTEHWLTVTGRGKCKDLIDCSASLDRVFANARLDDICTLAAFELDIGVTVSKALTGVIDTLPAIPFRLVAITETPWDIIEECCRFCGALAFELEDGTLCLAIAGDETGASGVQLGANIESAISVKSEVNRFSTVSAVLHTFNDATDIGVNLMPAYTGTDPGARKNRKKYIVSEQPVSDRTYLQRRVDWQIARAYGQSRKLSLLVDSWVDSAGKPWRINSQIPVSLPLLKIPENTMLLLAEVTFILDQHGTHAELVLGPKQGYLPEPLVLQRIDPDLAP